MRLIPLAVLGLSLAGCTQIAATMNRPEAPRATAAQTSAATAVTRAPSPRPAPRRGLAPPWGRLATRPRVGSG